MPGLGPGSIVPTVGLNVGRVEAHHAQLLFWDLGGQAGLRTIWDKYYAEAHALLYVVDATRPSRCAACWVVRHARLLWQEQGGGALA